MDAITKAKAFKAFLKALDYGRYFLLVGFSIIFGFLALVALLAGEFSIMSLIGCAGCIGVSWTCWSIRED